MKIRSVEANKRKPVFEVRVGTAVLPFPYPKADPAPGPDELAREAIQIRAHRVNDRRVDERGERQRFVSGILPPWMRRSPRVAKVLST